MKRTEPTPGSVVVGVDGSDHALRAVHLAADQARQAGRPLTVVHVTRERDRQLLSWPAYYGVFPAPEDAVEPGPALADAISVATRLQPDLTVTGQEAVGDPGRVLVAASRAAELVVVGSRGRGPVATTLLGSVSQNVAQHAHCPVIVSRPTPSGAVGRGVVVGADLTPESRPVIEFAFRQASLLDTSLVVVHCTGDDQSPRNPHAVNGGTEEMRMLLSESIAGLAERYPDVHATSHISQRHIDEYLTHGSARPWHLIVVGRHSEHGLDRWLVGSNSTAVLERANCPVAIVPQAGARRRRAGSVATEQTA